MKKEELFELLGELDDDIIKSAGSPVKKAVNWKILRTAAIAAVLAAAFIVPTVAYAAETVRYNAAVEYLRALGVDVADLSDYSKKEVISAVEVYEAYGTKDGVIENLMQNAVHKELPSEPINVTSEQIKQLTPTMTVKDVTALLGETLDIGSGIYILMYNVDGAYTLTIPFAGDDAQLGVYGVDMLKALQPGDVESVSREEEESTQPQEALPAEIEDTVHWDEAPGREEYSEVLELNGTEYNIYNEKDAEILQKYGISELTADLAGEHICYLGFQEVGDRRVYVPVGKAGPEEENDIELFEYAPNPDENIYIMCRAGEYFAVICGER